MPRLRGPCGWCLQLTVAHTPLILLLQDVQRLHHLLHRGQVKRLQRHGQRLRGGLAHRRGDLEQA